MEGVESESWSAHFFNSFIISDNRKVKEIYLNESLKLDSQNAVFNILKSYTTSSSCHLSMVYGYYEIQGLFRKAFPA